MTRQELIEAIIEARLQEVAPIVGALGVAAAGHLAGKAVGAIANKFKKKPVAPSMTTK